MRFLVAKLYNWKHDSSRKWDARGSRVKQRIMSYYRVTLSCSIPRTVLRYFTIQCRNLSIQTCLCWAHASHTRWQLCRYSTVLSSAYRYRYSTASQAVRTSGYISVKQCLFFQISRDTLVCILSILFIWIIFYWKRWKSFSFAPFLLFNKPYELAKSASAFLRSILPNVCKMIDRSFCDCSVLKEFHHTFRKSVQGPPAPGPSPPQHGIERYWYQYSTVPLQYRKNPAYRRYWATQQYRTCWRKKSYGWLPCRH